MNSESTTPSRLREAFWRPPYVTLLGWAAAGTPVACLWTAWDQAANPPTCFGIGWGCTPDAEATAALFAIIVGVPACVLGTLVFAGLGLRHRRTRRLRLQTALFVPPALALALVATAIVG